MSRGCAWKQSVLELIVDPPSPAATRKPTAIPDPRANVQGYLYLRKQDEPRTAVPNTYSRNKFVCFRWFEICIRCYVDGYV
jgi:hypothetical protein